MEYAIFGAGCFWGVEESFRQMPGVLEAEAGYSGGSTEHPSYREVCSNTTGHAETVRVAFDPERVTYDQLLDAFWSMHDPTTPDRQGPDAGTQYRSAVFTYSPEQERAARASRDRLAASGRYTRPIVTEIAPAGTFWRAEEYHQRYLEKQGARSCRR